MTLKCRNIQNISPYPSTIPADALCCVEVASVLAFVLSRGPGLLLTERV